MPGLKLPAGENLEIDPGSPFLAFLLAYPTVKKAKQTHFRRVEQFLKSIRYQPFDEFSESDETEGLIPRWMVEEWSARYRATGDPGESASMKLLHSYHHDRAKFDEIVTLLGPDGLDLVRDITIQSYSTGSPSTIGGGGPRKSVYERVGFAPSSGPKESTSPVQPPFARHQTRRTNGRFDGLRREFGHAH